VKQLLHDNVGIHYFLTNVWMLKNETIEVEGWKVFVTYIIREAHEKKKID
jgi:hypothetical protein